MTKPEKLPYPTILAVDSTQKDQISLALLRQGKKNIIKSQSSRAQDLQQFIKEFLLENSLTLKDLKAVAVYRIADSLTGTRMGITAVNIVAWLYDIPIIELDTKTFTEGIELITSHPKKLQITQQSKPLG